MVSSDAMAADGGDTIAAIATAPGEAGISIVRISGPAALGIADRILRCRPPPPSQRPHGTFLYGHVVDPAARDAEHGDLDEAILLIFRAPRSYTAEDLVEVQGHGGRTAARRILRAALRGGARPAEPGEFTRRAFLNGRIDLLQAEAVLDVIRASSDRAAAAAMEQLEGRLSVRMAEVRDALLSAAADIEACLDVPDDEIEPPLLPSVAGLLSGAERHLSELIGTLDEGRVLREGALVVIMGRPNVGKSTLFNALLGFDRAIVATQPGTTRDTLEESLVIDGIPIRLMDTAGLRESGCHVEAEGVRRAFEGIRKADVRVLVLDSSQSITHEDNAHIGSLRRDKDILVFNKADICQVLQHHACKDFRCLIASASQGVGIEDIKLSISSVLAMSGDAHPHAAISERHAASLVRCREGVVTAVGQLQGGRGDELVFAASSLRAAIGELDVLMGLSYDAELLDRIFSRFCVGK